MESSDKLIIEAGGKKIEIPLHLAEITLHKDWTTKGKETPELIIRAKALDKEETKKMGEMYALIC